MTFTGELGLLSLSALSIGFLHTLLGPDHYIPFVAMARAGRWSLAKTMLVTLFCGFAHVGSSVILGLVGVAMGVAVFKLETIESVRGSVAGWLLIAFGMAYFVWGVWRAIRNRPHAHVHAHSDGTVHVHDHTHHGEHLHVHDRARQPAQGGEEPTPSLTPWVLFTIFGFGPCEPLIPLVMYPAAKGNLWGVCWVTTLFGLVTLATMIVMVYAGYLGLSAVRLGGLHRYAHAAAGLVVLACGVAVKAGL